MKPKGLVEARRKYSRSEKAILKELEGYFNKSDLGSVSFLCTHLLMDLRRLYLLHELDEKQSELLLGRLANNLWSIFEPTIVDEGEKMKVFPHYQVHQDVE